MLESFAPAGRSVFFARNFILTDIDMKCMITSTFIDVR